jgi:arabinogalactan oligomer / maltooligosaccharide transport system substrate-binding protein
MKRNILKKSISLCLVSTLAISILSGCTDKTTDAPTDTLSEVQDGIIEEDGLFWDIANSTYILEEDIASGKVPLKLWIDNDGFGEFLVEGFMAKYPGTVLEFQNVGSADTIDKMALDGEAGTGGDVFLMPHDHVASGLNSSILGMMGNYEEEIKDRFLESAVNTVTYDNVIYGIPFLTESIALFYNQTLLDQLVDDGVLENNEPAKDFNDIIELAGKYNNEANNKYAIRWNAEDPYVNFPFLGAFGFRPFGEEGIDAENVGFNSSEVLAGLEYFKNLRPIWNINSGDITTDFTTIEFAKGDTPYLIMGPWAIEDVTNGSIENEFEFGITTIPLMDGRQPYTFSGNQIIAVSSYSKYPAAARVLAMYLASDEVLAYTYEELNKIPALNEQYANNIPGLKDDANVQGVMAQAEFSIAMPSIPEIAFFWDPAALMYKSVWDNIATPQEASIKAENDYNTLRQTAQ